ncbi:MAG: YdcF family protein [Lachnospiraceae bacterium]|nr:YdcF family protein [Lachnospiraceae bacterium]
MRHCLEMGCLSIGILCLLYYIGIVIYSGITTSFAWIWPTGGTALILLRIALWYQKLHPSLWLRVLTGAAFALILAALLMILLIGGRIIGAMRAVPQQDLDYVIVLGAQVRGTNPSRALLKRLERAAEYAEENPDTILILSGGQGPDEGISEAECMYRYLTGAGVSEDRLIREDASTSTQENLLFSAEIIHSLAGDMDGEDIRGLGGDTDEEDLRGLDGGTDEEDIRGLGGDTDKEEAERNGMPNTGSSVTASVGVLSNDFHIYRALLLAQKAGYTNVSGIPADSVPGMQPHNILREICALLVMMVSH